MFAVGWGWGRMIVQFAVAFKVLQKFVSAHTVSTICRGPAVPKIIGMIAFAPPTSYTNDVVFARSCF